MKRSPGKIAEQRVLTQKLADTLTQSPGTMAAPTVVANPYGLSPLSALVCFKTAQAEAFRVQLRDAAGETYLEYDTPRETVHRTIVPALINGEACTFVAEGEGGSHVEVALPVATIEPPLLTALEGEAPKGTLFFALAADGTGEPIALDAQGRLAWTLTLPLNHHLTFLENGHFLCGAPLQMAPPYSGTAIWEMDALGHIYHEWRFEDGFVSDFARLSDGTLVVISQKAWQGKVRDTLLWLDAESGEIVKRLAASDVLPATGGTAGQTGTDWFGGTSLRLDPAAGLLYWSGVAQNVVLEVDAQRAKVTRIIADYDAWEALQTAENVSAQHMTSDWLQTQTRADLFTRPVAAGTFEEAYGVQRRGDSLYYVNANRYPLGRKLSPKPFTVNVLDLASGQVSMFLPNKDALVSPVFCDLTLLDEGVALVLAGGLSNSESRLPGIFARERQEDIALSAQVFLYKDGAEQAQWIFDDNIVHVNLWQPEQLAFATGEEAVRGEWAPCFEIDIDLPYVHTGRLEEEMHLEFWQDDARLYLSGTFFKGEACTLILSQGEERHQFFLNTNRAPYGTEWLYTYGASDVERRLNWAVPCANLTGTWQITLQIEDTRYLSEEHAIFLKENK